MKSNCSLLSAIFALLWLGACTPNPESLAKKYNEEVYAFLEKGIKDASGSAFNLVVPIYQTELLYDSLRNAGMEKITDEEAQTVFLDKITVPEKYDIYKEQWKRVVEKCRSQLKYLPTNTWMINEDTMSPSSIFKVNKGYTEMYPYNYLNVHDVGIPSNEFIPSRYGMASMLFFDYNPNNEKMEIRNLKGKVGHFRKASQKEMVMGHFVNSFGDEMYVTKNSDIAIKETTWYVYYQSLDVTQITIDGEEYAKVFKGVSRDRNDAIDALITGDGMYSSNSENYVWRRQRTRTLTFDFLFKIPEDEINVEEIEIEDEIETE